MLSRLLQLPELLEKKSHFLFGARATGKTSLIREQLLPEKALSINLLNSDFYLRLAARPAELETIIQSANRKWIVIDEIQKLPALLDEVHRLIEERKLTFLLTGSSARKLVRGGANLLGGRAWKARLFPLTSREIPDFDLHRYLRVGGLPAVYLSEHPEEEIAAYVQTYLTEEIAAEGITRDLPRFSRFLQNAAMTNAELVNFSNIASDLGVSPTTVREHYRILEDTLVGYKVEPFRKKALRKEISTAKFYLFDTGACNALRRVKSVEEGTQDFGKLFEHFIALELQAALHYQRVDIPLTFWRTHSQHEVDFVVKDLLAIEVKASRRSSMRALTGLKEFSESYSVKTRAVVSLDPIERIEDGIHFWNYEQFLRRLWEGELF